MQKKSVATKFLIVTGVIFFIIWAIYDFFIYPTTLKLFPVVTCVLIKNLFKILIWVIIPFYLLKKKYDLSVHVSSKSMFSVKFHWKELFLTLICFFMYNVILAWLTSGTLKIGNNFTFPIFLNSVLFVGITEEMMFRGWFLNTFLEKMSQWKAILLSSILFLIVHFPSWIMKGFFFTTSFPISAISVILLSVIFSISFIKNNTLIAPIVLHMFWNFFQIVFF